MKNIQEITPEFIKRLSYTDFVGFVNQWNVLPDRIRHYQNGPFILK